MAFEVWAKTLKGIYYGVLLKVENLSESNYETGSVLFS